MSAFEMTASALTKLDENPRRTATQDLVRNLFTKNGQNPIQKPMHKVRKVLARIRRFYRHEVVGSSEPDVSDIIVFCDLKRFEKMDEAVWGKNIWEDTYDVMMETNVGRFVVKLAHRNMVFAEIDKVLLHEMTHGRNVFYRDWDDLDAGSSYSVPDGTEAKPENHNVQIGIQDVDVSTSIPYPTTVNRARFQQMACSNFFGASQR
ncbi:hypothetical protein EJ02DRAFT_475871 [Clathrospora elynae]|uniref:Uncharacterized protein n=1 Tax=Clathrospora elynae TaxID=706981 RepID=A0A6A5SYS3_9PLEO|nr:hypothetical protein EJ02DRAFT_475871 [Clathrospora elynae]